MNYRYRLIAGLLHQKCYCYGWPCIRFNESDNPNNCQLTFYTEWML